ncbi:MAG: octaprenyl diphosphate synthase [Deltaproteobacteria bacterium DG_8]|nr:MAG: octaprenyl diphosphate synthase [Deltaproteobacteria bacterium DG_8]
MQQISSLIGDELEKVEVKLINQLSSEVPLINKVGGYIIGSGGKRIRPLMLLLVAKYCNYSGEQHIPLACIFEYIHTASLLHDDVLDNAKVRRGNSSVNSVWGDRTSVLVGDFLLSMAFSHLVKIEDLKIMKVVSDAATQMAEGETMQTERSGDTDLSEEEYITVISNKTASLIAAACQVGALLGNSSTKREHIFKNYGLNLGIAFQMVDDTLDYISEDERFGKITCKDLREGKITLPLIHTLREASARDMKTILKILKSNSLDKKNLCVITELIEKYQGIGYVLRRAKEYINSSIHCIKVLDSSPVKDALITTADYVLQRKW